MITFIKTLSGTTWKIGERFHRPDGNIVTIKSIVAPSREDIFLAYIVIGTHDYYVAIPVTSVEYVIGEK